MTTSCLPRGSGHCPQLLWEFDNAGAIMCVDETLRISFQVSVG